MYPQLTVRFPASLANMLAGASTAVVMIPKDRYHGDPDDLNAAVSAMNGDSAIEDQVKAHAKANGMEVDSFLLARVIPGDVGSVSYDAENEDVARFHDFVNPADVLAAIGRASAAMYAMERYLGPGALYGMDGAAAARAKVWQDIQSKVVTGEIETDARAVTPEERGVRPQ